MLIGDLKGMWEPFMCREGESPRQKALGLDVLKKPEKGMWLEHHEAGG